MHGEHAAVDDAGIGKVDNEAVGITALKFLGKEGDGEFAVGIGAELAVVAGREIEEVAVDMGEMTGEGDGADDVRTGVEKRKELTGEEIGAEIVGGGDPFEALWGGGVGGEQGAGIVEESVDVDALTGEALDKRVDGIGVGDIERVEPLVVGAAGGCNDVVALTAQGQYGSVSDGTCGTGDDDGEGMVHCCGG